MKAPTFEWALWPLPPINRRCAHTLVLAGFHALKDVGTVAGDTRCEVFGVGTAVLNNPVMSRVIQVLLFRWWADIEQLFRLSRSLLRFLALINDKLKHFRIIAQSGLTLKQSSKAQKKRAFVAYLCNGYSAAQEGSY